MTKNRKIENIADVVTQVHKLYLQRGFKITHMHNDCEFEPLRKEMTTIGINLNRAYKSNMSLKLNNSSGPLRSASDPPKPPCRSNEYPS